MLLKKTFLAVLLGFGLMGQAHSDSVFKNDVVTVVLHEEQACSKPLTDAVAAIRGSNLFIWNKATVVFQGQKLDACFTVSDDAVIVIDETGDGGAIPKQMFKPVKNT